jgi:Rha family phage regulatory protein
MATKNKPQIRVVMKEEQPVTSSKNVAENFGKRHDNTIRDIENLLKEDPLNFEEMFKEGSEPDSYGRPQKVYYMNRDGFSFLVMGFTGSKAREFKLAYIDQFNKMEERIKNQLDISRLSPDLQMFHKLFNSIAEQQIEFSYQKERQEKLENKLDGITDIMSMESKDWRKEANATIRKIAFKLGGPDKISEIANESYDRLENKARCNLSIRLENRRKNMIAQGLGKTSVKNLNRLDIIEEDHRLKEIYVSVVKSMALKYGLWEEQK